MRRKDALHCVCFPPPLNGGRGFLLRGPVSYTHLDVYKRQVMPFAASLEMIHTYSLIHDDLPAMDDDDLRRGRPSCHKAFDEATAILAGDALLTDAFGFMASTVKDLPAGRVLEALASVSTAAGSAGMVGGQDVYKRQGWAGIFCLFAASGLHYCPSLRARTHPKGSPFHSEVHLCAGVNGTSPL